MMSDVLEVSFDDRLGGKLGVVQHTLDELFVGVGAVVELKHSCQPSVQSTSRELIPHAPDSERIRRE